MLNVRYRTWTAVLLAAAAVAWCHAFAAALDLAGRRMSISDCDGYAAVTSSVPGGVLEINVPEGETFSNSALEISGGANLQVWKTGAGTLVMTKVNDGFGAAGATSMVVKAGVVRKTKTNNATCGAPYSRIVVEDGAQFDVCGSSNTTYYDFTISGSGPDGLGAIVNKTTVSSVYGTAYVMRNIDLASNASIGGTSYVSLKSGDWVPSAMAMNGRTITYTNVTVYAGNMRYEGEGRIDVRSALSFYQHSTSASNCEVRVCGSLNQNAGGFTAVKSLIFERGANFWSKAATGHPTTVVFDTYAPNMRYTRDGGTLTGPIVQLGDAEHLTPTLDLSRFCTNGVDVVFGAEKTTFHPGATVSVKLGDRSIGDMAGKKIASWSTRPGGVVFVSGDEGRSCLFAAEADGLYIYRGFSVLLY